MKIQRINLSDELPIVEVRELTVKQIKQQMEPLWEAMFTISEAMKAGGGDTASLSGVLLAMPDQLVRILAGSTGLQVEDLEDMGMADLCRLADAWLEVNAAFFGQLMALKDKAASLFARAGNKPTPA